VAATVILDEDFQVPFVGSLVEFRQWAASDSYPESGRIDYLAGRIEVDVSPEDLYTHGKLKTTLIAVLQRIVEKGDLGDLFSDRARVSCPEADLSAEPDLVFVSYGAVEGGRVRLVPKSTGEADRYVEMEGPPDLAVEIVSDRSAQKDTERLPQAYWRARIPEFWLADARGPALVFQIHRWTQGGYEPAPAGADGSQYSAIFRAWFGVTRRRNRAGRWTYDCRATDESATSGDTIHN